MPVIVVLLWNSLLLTLYVSDEVSFRELGDLGNLLLGGFVLAVVIAIAFTFVRLRLREKKPPPAQFISISSSEKK
jgi:hypothetical protein